MKLERRQQQPSFEEVDLVSDETVSIEEFHLNGEVDDSMHPYMKSA